MVGALLVFGAVANRASINWPARVPRFGMKGREVPGYFVGIHELAATQQAGQQDKGGGGFARPVAVG